MKRKRDRTRALCIWVHEKSDIGSNTSLLVSMSSEVADDVRIGVLSGSKMY